MWRIGSATWRSVRRAMHERGLLIIFYSLKPISSHRKKSQTRYSAVQIMVTYKGKGGIHEHNRFCILLLLGRIKRNHFPIWIPTSLCFQCIILVKLYEKLPKAMNRIWSGKFFPLGFVLTPLVDPIIYFKEFSCLHTTEVSGWNSE